MNNKITLTEGSGSQLNRKSIIENRKLEAGSGERESILNSALDLCEERGGQASKPCNQTSLVDGFDLFGHGFGRKGEPGDPLGDDRVTGREVGRVLGDSINQFSQLVVVVVQKGREHAVLTP